MYRVGLDEPEPESGVLRPASACIGAGLTLCSLRRRKPMAAKARSRPSWKKNTTRYKKVTALAQTLEGQKNLAKKKRYANRHG